MISDIPHVPPSEEVLPAVGGQSQGSTSGPRPRPSLLPMIDEEREGCAMFLPQRESDILEDGKDRHAALREMFEGQSALVELLPSDQAEGVRWAADYVRSNIPHLDWPMRWEASMQLLDDDFRVMMSGTPDLVCGPHIVDLKWRKRDYTAQFVCYLLMRFQEEQFEKITMHALWGAYQQYERREWTEAECWAELRRVLDAYDNPAPKVPKACAYCGWCARRLECPAFNLPAVVVAQNREDWGLTTYHISQITDPADMAKAIELVPKLRKFCDAIDFYKREWAVARGIKIPGYRVRDEKGDREITDLPRALVLMEEAGLPQRKVLPACGMGVTALKKAWAEHFGISQDAADKEIDRVLASVIRRTPGKTVVKE